MKLVCTQCGTIAEQGTKWCQNRVTNCPPGTLSRVFDHGEMFDELEIAERLRVLPTAALYTAKRGREAVLLKVAHTGGEDRLKEEARLLAGLEPHPALPRLLSASLNDQRAYNRFSFQDEMRYYLLLEPVEGAFLRDRLAANPYLPPQLAAWLVISLADAVAYLHVRAGRLALNISPDNILVRVDREGVLRPLLIDLALASAPEAVNPAWFGRSNAPAYLAPEQLRGQACGPQTDVYALGLVLYETLAGEPAFPFKLRADAEIRAAVLNTEPTPLDRRRRELSQGVAGVVSQALNKAPQARQPDARTFAKGLRLLFDEVPPEKKGMQIDRRLIAAAAFIALALLLILMLWLLTQS